MCDNTTISDYDIQIDADYYNNDFDVIDFENQSEPITESDILFE